MISYLTSADMSIIAFIGVIFAFALTCIAIAKLNKFLYNNVTLLLIKINVRRKNVKYRLSLINF